MKKVLLATAALVLPAAIAGAQTANISVTDLVVSGVSASAMQASSSPTYIPNDGETFIAVQQAGTAKTGTIRTQATQINAQGMGPITLADQTLLVPSGTGVVLAGPFPTGRWNNPAYGTVKIDWSAPVSLTVIRLPQ